MLRSALRARARSLADAAPRRSLCAARASLCPRVSPAERACARAQPKPIVSGTAAGEAPQIGISSLATVELRSQIGDLMYSESAVLSDVLMFDAPTGKEFR